MAKTILPSGETVNSTPTEVKKYVNPDNLRQVFRQERIRWGLKVNKDCDFIDQERLFKYISELHNEGQYQRMEIHTDSDNGAYAGYAGINNDSGVFGLPHNVDKWPDAISDESKKKIINRTTVGASAFVADKKGYGLNEVNELVEDSSNRMASIVFDPFDGRAYLLSNDEDAYVNNETRSPSKKLPGRTVARISDIPTRAAQLVNDLHYLTDENYTHTDNNFSNSNRFVVDNLDDRTFVYPEIAKDADGNYIENIRIGLNGKPGYNESDGSKPQNSYADPYGDRGSASINSYNAHSDFSGVNHPEGYIPGVFKSLAELEKVDLTHQKQVPRDASAPGAKRPNNYYIHDGLWNSSWQDKKTYNVESMLAHALNPSNLDMYIPGAEPKPYASIGNFDNSKLYQWRYNRLSVQYKSENVQIHVTNGGTGYRLDDILEWNFLSDYFQFRVTRVGANGQIEEGRYIIQEGKVFDQDPSTNGVAVEFANTTSEGSGALFTIEASGTIDAYATQLKNNLYAYVDVTPTVRSDTMSAWADTKITDTQGGRIGVRSTAAGPSYSGINSGRGGDIPDDDEDQSILTEHGGNPTAGVHVHLFRYVINTTNPVWDIVDDVQVFTGEWVDQGPLGLERPCDIKALLFSNYDTNNYNNYYKFMNDVMIDRDHRNPDAVVSGNSNALSTMYLHVDQKDPDSDTRFTVEEIDPETGLVKERDVTRQTLYINAATGVLFLYNTGYKSDESHFGYGTRKTGWFAVAGAVSR